MAHGDEGLDGVAVGRGGGDEGGKGEGEGA